jgi:hypothetical protein
MRLDGGDAGREHPREVRQDHFITIPRVATYEDLNCHTFSDTAREPWLEKSSELLSTAWLLGGGLTYVEQLLDIRPHVRYFAMYFLGGLGSDCPLLRWDAWPALRYFANPSIARIRALGGLLVCNTKHSAGLASLFKHGRIVQ